MTEYCSKALFVPRDGEDTRENDDCTYSEVVRTGCTIGKIGARTHTWCSHSVDDLLIVYHQQVPLLPARSIMHRAVAGGIGIPQIWCAFISIAIARAIIATKSKA